MMIEDSNLTEMIQRAKIQLLPEVLSITPELNSVNLSKKVYSFILETVDKVMRPKRRPECELLMILEDIFTNLNNELIENNIDYTEFKFSIDETYHGPSIDLKVVCMDKIMLQLSLNASMLIPLLNKRYAELKMPIRV